MSLESICYKKNFIKAVIFRVDFSPLLILKETEPKEFQEEIRKYCPNLEIQDAFKHTVNIKQKDASTQMESFKQYIFSDKEKSKSIILSYTYLIIEFRKYDKFDEFKLLVEEVYKNFKDKYSPLNITRIGLRYVNEINIDKGNPYEWGEYINDSLISTYKPFYENEYYNRLLSQIYYSFDDYRLTFTYGTPNSIFPNKISRKEFLLDFDCYIEHVEEENVIQQLKSFHERIQDLFEKCIKQELRNLMEEIK